jgi:membrane protein implicated in regulation of membrane protease activity
MNSQEKMVEELRKLAKAETIGDLRDVGEDVVIDDYAGGNVDDAYWTGYNDGMTELARKVLVFLVDGD